MKINLDNLPLEAVCGSTPPIAVSINANNIYKDGTPTGETDGFRLSIVSPGKDFSSLSVKLPDGGVDLGGMENNDISVANAACKFVFVGFRDFSAKAYVGRDGKLGASAIATKVFLVDLTGKPKAVGMTGGVSNA